tara:strand:+ start:49 stop:210 length:162 start_codon:yes stop_codon:yes gene_type:complete
MNQINLTDRQLEYLEDLVTTAYSLDVPEQKDWDIKEFDGLVDAVCGSSRVEYL